MTSTRRKIVPIREKADPIGGDSWRCKVCKEEFDNSKSMRNHYQHHHIKQDFPCEDCNYTAKHRAHLTEHADLHEPLDDLDITLGRCDFCQNAWTKKLGSHLVDCPNPFKAVRDGWYLERSTGKYRRISGASGNRGVDSLEAQVPSDPNFIHDNPPTQFPPSGSFRDPTRSGYPTILPSSVAPRRRSGQQACLDQTLRNDQIDARKLRKAQKRHSAVNVIPRVTQANLLPPNNLPHAYSNYFSWTPPAHLDWNRAQLDQISKPFPSSHFDTTVPSGNTELQHLDHLSIIPDLQLYPPLQSHPHLSHRNFRIQHSSESAADPIAVAESSSHNAIQHSEYDMLDYHPNLFVDQSTLIPPSFVPNQPTAIDPSLPFMHDFVPQDNLDVSPFHTASHSLDPPYSASVPLASPSEYHPRSANQIPLSWPHSNASLKTLPRTDTAIGLHPVPEHVTDYRLRIDPHLYHSQFGGYDLPSSFPHSSSLDKRDHDAPDPTSSVLTNPRQTLPQHQSFPFSPRHRHPHGGTGYWFNHNLTYDDLPPVDPRLTTPQSNEVESSHQFHTTHSLGKAQTCLTHRQALRYHDLVQ